MLASHEVATAYECGWSTLKNGELLSIAEHQGFEVLVTTDTDLHDQQNLASRRIAKFAQVIRFHCTAFRPSST